MGFNVSNDKMNEQEKAAKQVEVAGWLKSKGYDRRTWQGMAKIIVDYLDEQPVEKLGSAFTVSDERSGLCQSFVVDTTTSSATKCANCQKEAWEHISSVYPA